MPLHFDASHFVGPKIQSLQTENLRLQEKVKELETKNALLNLRLANNQNETRNVREDIIHFKVQNEAHCKTRTRMSAPFQETKKRLCEIKSDLKNLESNVRYAFDGAQNLFDGHLQDLMFRFEKAQLKDGDLRELIDRVTELEIALQEANDNHIKEKKRRRKLHNTLIELRGNIRVHCRLRPLQNFDNRLDHSKEEFLERGDACGSPTNLGQLGSPSEQVIHPIDDESVVVTQQKPGSTAKNFEFDHVFFPEDAQDVVFNEVLPLITSLLDGYNVCIMAYGQTGSGKTHTMLGNEKEPGVVPRSANELFKLIDEKAPGSISVHVSVVEVYNNEIYDLLSENPKSTKHEITSTEEGGLDTTSTIQMEVHSSAEIEKWTAHGLRHRAMITTKVHEHSSRSHLVVTLTVTNHETTVSSPRKSSHEASTMASPSLLSKKGRRLPHPNPPSMTSKLVNPQNSCSCDDRDASVTTGDSCRTKLQLVDLAGSECVGMSGVTGPALRETSFINRSLSALSDVLCALSEKRSHIPYRNSRLTRLLQDSVGGDAKLLLMLCVSPAQRYLVESMQCLNFGQRARQVQRGPPKKRGYSVTDSPTRPLSPRDSPLGGRKLRFQ